MRSQQSEIQSVSPLVSVDLLGQLLSPPRQRARADVSELSVCLFKPLMKRSIHARSEGNLLCTSVTSWMRQCFFHVRLFCHYLPQAARKRHEVFDLNRRYVAAEIVCADLKCNNIWKTLVMKPRSGCHGYIFHKFSWVRCRFNFLKCIWYMFGSTPQRLKTL